MYHGSIRLSELRRQARSRQFPTNSLTNATTEEEERPFHNSSSLLYQQSNSASTRVRLTRIRQQARSGVSQTTNITTSRSRVGGPSACTMPRSSTRTSYRRHERCARNFTDNGILQVNKLLDKPDCTHCGAKLFTSETSEMCCLNGKVKLPPLLVPVQLYRLYSEETVEAKHFRKNIRIYNHMFAFTSIGVNIDQSLANGQDGTYTFRALGSIYHKIGSILPTEGQRPRYLQMYIYDTEHEIDNRLSENADMNRNLVQLIKYTLDHHNRYVHEFRRLAMRDDLSNCRIHIKEQPLRRHNYDLPSETQVAAILVGADDPMNVAEREIVVQTQDGQLQFVPDTASYYDPLQYPLLLPFGDSGWCVDTYGTNGRKIPCRAFYSYLLQIRRNDTSPFLRAGRLLMQYVVDNYIKLETHRLRFFRTKQATIRAELYKGLQDSFNTGENNAGNVGRQTILPATHIGSPRDMYHRYQDAMALVQNYGKPDLFITMTCNPAWDEIQKELLPGQVHQDRPDLTTRVFHAKAEEFKADIYQHGILGSVVAHTHVIEFQKRGLPHMHILVIFNENDRLTNPDEYDDIVRAEIPDPDLEPELFQIVTNHMMHGPCGRLKRDAPCMKEQTIQGDNSYAVLTRRRDGRDVFQSCKKGFPRQFADQTVRGDDSYAVLRRRRDGRYVIKNGKKLDNRWVVPYNPWLLKKYNCHINVEICSSIKAVKYLYKYIHKGPDRVAFEVRHQHPNQHDEISQYEDGRWVCAQEAFWRLFMFPLGKIYPSVVALPVHMPNMQEVRYHENQQIGDLLQDDSLSRTMLTEFFTTNSNDAEACHLLYREFPEQFRWDQAGKCWIRRGNHLRSIGRLCTVRPTDGDRYYLRILLNHVKGPKSFDDLKTVGGTKYNSFKESAKLRGLLEDDNSNRECLREASATHMPSSLRRLFATILIYCQPITVSLLWDEFYPYLCEDYPTTSLTNDSRRVNHLLRDLDTILAQHGHSLSEFDLPQPSEEYNDYDPKQALLEEELAIPISYEDLESVHRLNYGQQIAYRQIVEAVRAKKGALFFVDGPGGTGKSYLYRALLATLRKEGYIAIATASSGIAATLLPGGLTAHSRFKIPISIDASSVCYISKQSPTAELLKKASLLLWDEATMTHRHAYEALDRTLRDIMGIDIEFGGKTVVLGGDFRQLLPVVPHGTRSQTTDACVINSHFWGKVKVLHLTENMRSRLDPEFSDFLLKVGDGNLTTVEDEMVRIPDEMLIPSTTAYPIQDLINNIYPDIRQNGNGNDFVVDRALMTPTNDEVDDINSKVINSFPGSETIYYSFDQEEDDKRNLYQQDYLNSICPGGLPPHKLTLKEGAPIILLRNIDPKNGLCNGTRLLCRMFNTNVIDAEIATGQFKGTRVFIPRIPLKPSENVNLGFTLIRKQFPIRLCFAMTINKAQGQTIPHAGIYLPQHCFSHGQLYVALSRGISSTTTKVLIKNGALQSFLGTYTKNVVYKEVLLPSTMLTSNQIQ